MVVRALKRVFQMLRIGACENKVTDSGRDGVNIFSKDEWPNELVVRAFRKIFGRFDSEGNKISVEEV